MNHVVLDWLGHADISSTSRYRQASRADHQKYVKAFERKRAAAGNSRRSDSHTVRTQAQALDAAATVENPSKALN